MGEAEDRELSVHCHDCGTTTVLLTTDQATPAVIHQVRAEHDGHRITITFGAPTRFAPMHPDDDPDSTP